jgi:hypothetical protein
MKAILTSLRDFNVRYVVAGGLAVNAYAYLRFTKDADLAIELVPENIHAAFAALATLDYRREPRARPHRLGKPATVLSQGNVC